MILGIRALSGVEDPILDGRALALIIGAYLAGGASGGLVVGILSPLMRWPLDLMCVGIPVATLAFGSFALALLL